MVALNTCDNNAAKQDDNHNSVKIPATLSSEHFEGINNCELADAAEQAFIEQSASPAFSGDMTAILEFLGCTTPAAWLTAAVADLPTILQDHANCEKKAASTAMNLLFRYDNFAPLQSKLSQLIREEMLHYEQVMQLMAERGQAWRYLPAGRYAAGLLKHKRTYEPQALIDVLIIGAFIEARSCERFFALSKVVADERLARYYRYLLKSESRHFTDYLALAELVVAEQQLNVDIADRVDYFRQVEASLITTADNELRFHSGIPSR